MDLWSPPHDAPHLLEWWRPLMLVSRRARLDRFPWPVHLDEFRLRGRVIRKGRPDIWIYDHHENGGSVCVDAAGQTYKFTATPKGKGMGQFRACPVRTALWRARLPEVVEPMWYEEPTHPLAGPWGDHDDEAPADDATELDADIELDDADADADADEAHDTGPGASSEAGPRVIRRGHLSLVSGLAG